MYDKNYSSNSVRTDQTLTYMSDEDLCTINGQGPKVHYNQHSSRYTNKTQNTIHQKKILFQKDLRDSKSDNALKTIYLRQRKTKWALSIQEKYFLTIIYLSPIQWPGSGKKILLKHKVGTNQILILQLTIYQR